MAHCRPPRSTPPTPCCLVCCTHHPLHADSVVNLRLQACKDTTKSLTLMVYDTCDGCEPNQVNLQAQPFSKLTDLGMGVIKIAYRQVRRALKNAANDNMRRAGGLLWTGSSTCDGAPLRVLQCLCQRNARLGRPDCCSCFLASHLDKCFQQHGTSKTPQKSNKCMQVC